MRSNTKKVKERSKFPGLNKRVNSKTRHEYIDFDYIDQLNDKEKQWLSNFMEEYMSGNFKHPGRIFHKSHKSKKECYHRNNARNRDVVAVQKATGRLRHVDKPTLSFMETGGNSTLPPKNGEDALIDLIDLQMAGITAEVVENTMFEDFAPKRKVKRKKLKKKLRNLSKRENSRARKKKF